MFCPTCGKSIPDESIFCMFCGKGIPDRTPPNTASRPTKETPPIAVQIQGFWLQGASEVKRPPFYDTRIGRGFAFGLSLIDSTNEETTSEGELTAALHLGNLVNRGQAPYNQSTYDENLLLDSTLRAAQGAKSGALWYHVFSLTKNDFKWGEWSYAFGKKVDHCAFQYSQMTPLVFAPAGRHVYLHVWFVTPDKKCLYKTGLWKTWEV